MPASGPEQDPEAGGPCYGRERSQSPDLQHLLQLDAEAIDTEALESKVLHEAQERLERRQLEDVISRATKDIEKLEKSCHEASEAWGLAEGELQSSEGRMGDRRLMRLLNQKDKWQVKLDKDKVRLEEAVQAKENAERELRLKNEQGDDDHDAGHVVAPAPAGGDIDNETEDQRQIRLGERTAFGHELRSKSSAVNQDEAGGLVNREMKRLASSTSASGSSPPSRKRWKRDVERRPLSDDEDRIRTDDSDWDTEEEEGGKCGTEVNTLVATHSRRKRKFHLGHDDGNKEHYIERIQELEASGELKACFSSYEELEAGLQVPKGLWDRLFNYQKVCVQWLWELHQQRVGGILGDEMGLGKTVQVIAFLAAMQLSQKKKYREKDSKSNFGPILIVCPATVMQQWVREFHRWWPLYRVAILHESGSHVGSRSSLIRSVVASRGVLVVSYSGVMNHKEPLLENHFEYVVLDEGHKIRNPDAQITLTVKQFATPHRLILSGSPLQNNLKELWSLFDFIYPGKLGTLPTFLTQFSVPITQGGYANASTVQVATAYKCATILRDTISPYLLRRMKADVKHMINLPQKNEQVLFCKLTEEQVQLYREYLMSDDIRRIMQGRMRIFVGLQNLRKLCNHPDLFGFRTEAYENYGAVEKSGKMIVVQALLRLWKKQGHRVLLFTQSRQMMRLLQRLTDDEDYTSLSMDGTTPVGSRQKLITRFNEDSSIFVFLLTTKVGGLGVNLTGASRVVIYDPDWNPSTDTQARERAWRIGQDKQVTIYRLMTAGTIEEKIYHRQIFKQFLVDRVLKDPKQRRFFKSNDLYELFTLAEASDKDRGRDDKHTTGGGTETSSIFAGTGSDVRVRKVPKKSKRPEQEKKGPKELTEKEKLMERVRKISQKIAANANKDPEAGQRNPDSDQKKHKRKKFKKVDGERVSHVVKTGTYRPPCGSDDQTDAAVASSSKEREQSGAEQDNYVLSKLFRSKSGSASVIHSAFQHDRVVESNVADFAIIEAEAEQAASRAVEALRESRRICFRASEGVPTWTGSNGAVSKGRPRFGKKKSKSVDESSESGRDSGGDLFHRGLQKSKGPMTSQDLLKKMRERNRFTQVEEAVGSSNGGSNHNEDDNLFFPTSNSSSAASRNPEEAEYLEVLTDIRNFVAFQSKKNGEASTREIVERFHQRLPAQQSPLFKALLNKICSFHRTFDGKGIWTLRGEFR